MGNRFEVMGHNPLTIFNGNTPDSSCKKACAMLNFI